jgi:polysaccharide pyruvyl transferase WcaK-like protein
MKKVIVFNNTSKYHNGCAKVMEYLHKDLQHSGYEILASIKGNTDTLPYPPEDYEQADTIIVNGEGTMHHSKIVPHQLINLLINAKKLGKKTALINTVWQSMSLNNEEKDVLRNTYISVREVMSQQALAEDDIKSDIHLDLSYFNDVPEKTTPHRELVIGKFFSQADYRPYGIPTIDIFKDGWNDIVNTLRSTDWFITGRHHEMYASCKARCPFATLAGNTWKNQSLFKTAGVNLLVGDDKLSHSEMKGFLSACEERRMEYEKLFNWMESQPKFTILGKL